MPAAKSEKVYRIKPLKWETVSEYCLLAKFVFWEMRVWTSKMHDGYWMFSVGSECIDGDYSKEKVVAMAESWVRKQLTKALSPVTPMKKARKS